MRLGGLTSCFSSSIWLLRSRMYWVESVWFSWPWTFPSSFCWQNETALISVAPDNRLKHNSIGCTYLQLPQPACVVKAGCCPRKVVGQRYQGKHCHLCLISSGAPRRWDWLLALTVARWCLPSSLKTSAGLKPQSLLKLLSLEWDQQRVHIGVQTAGFSTETQKQ